MRSVHATEIAPPEPIETVRPKHLGRTLNARRVAAAPIASRCLRDGIRAAGSSYGEVARALGVDPSRVADLADEAHEAALTVRDAIASPYSVAAETLDRARDAIDERLPAPLSVDRAGLAACAAGGELMRVVAEAMADGVITDDETLAIERASVQMKQKAHEVGRAARAARARAVSR